jgi:hypothetical protein
LSRAAYCILKLERPLRQQRRIREMRHLILIPLAQGLIWHDGEALCLTSEFQSELRGRIPSWLLLDQLPAQPHRFHRQLRVSLPQGGQGLLTIRREVQPLAGLWSWLWRRRPTSPELRQAGLLFRLQRAGVVAPRLLAFGQRLVRPWYIESFLLTEPWPDTLPLGQWLVTYASRRSEGQEQRCNVIRQAADLLRRLHDAHCYLGKGGIHLDLTTDFLVVLNDVEDVKTSRHTSQIGIANDLHCLRSVLGAALAIRTDELRFFLHYLRVPRLTREAKKLARSILCLPTPLAAPPIATPTASSPVRPFPLAEVRATS